jgi:hypothetical protein
MSERSTHEQLRPPRESGLNLSAIETGGDYLRDDSTATLSQ